MSRRGENIYKRKDGRWEGRYIKQHRLDGSIHYGYIYAYSYKEVKYKLLPLKEEKKYKVGTPTLGLQKVYKWIQDWLGEQKKQLKISTFSTYQYKLQRYVIPLIGEKNLSELTEQTIQEVVTAWTDTYNLASSTIINLFQILKKVLFSAFKKGYLTHNVCEEIKLPKHTKGQVRALTQKEQSKLESAAVKDPQGFPTIVSLYTGLRIGEVSALTWKDIDFSNQMLYVRRTYQRVVMPSQDQQTTLLLADAKTATSQRAIPLSKKVLLLLAKLKKNQTGPYVFTINNKPMEPRLLTYHFKRIAEKAGLNDIHFHQLRHTFATRCMEANGDIASISSLLGHSSTKMTLDIYVDSTSKQRKRIISAVDRLIKK